MERAALNVTAATTALALNARLHGGLAAIKAQLEAERAAVSLATQALEQGRQALAAAKQGSRLDILV
jgi:hypothetical protein